MRVCITGGTGSLGQALVRRLLKDGAERIVVLSRDEVKQARMAEEIGDPPPMRWMLGDVRDRDRLEAAFWGVEAVIHAAALKRVDGVSFHPTEVEKTNVTGTRNVLEAAVRAGVSKVLVVSSDKAVAPLNLYGASKFFAEQMAVAANRYAWPRGTRIGAVRYGNVLGSRGSAAHVFRRQALLGQPLTVTDPAMTRFIITMDQAVEFCLLALKDLQGGEIFIPVLPSARVWDIALAAADAWNGLTTSPARIMGLRSGGEKLHETLLSEDEATRARLQGESFYGGTRYVIPPSVHDWNPSAAWLGDRVEADFRYRSDTNEWWLSVEDLVPLLKAMPEEMI